MSEENVVTRLSPQLTGKQRRYLRSLGHGLRAIVMVGQKGVSEGLIENMDGALTAHELVKVKVHDAGAIDEVAQALHDATGAQLAQKIGKNLLFYRAHPEEPEIRLPRDRG